MTQNLDFAKLTPSQILNLVEIGVWVICWVIPVGVQFDSVLLIKITRTPISTKFKIRDVVSFAKSGPTFDLNFDM